MILFLHLMHLGKLNASPEVPTTVLIPQDNQQTEPNADTEPAEATQATEGDAVDSDKYTVLETNYCDLLFHKQYEDMICHVESSDNGSAVEVFYMISGEREVELFRVYFGPDEVGDLIGTLCAPSGEISVSVTACVYTLEDFADENEYILYHELMEELNTVINSIRSSEGFREKDENQQPIIEKGNVQLKYWTLVLPESMSWEETETAGLYLVDFYATVLGEQIKMYTIYMGEAEANTMLGYFKVGSENRPIWVKVYDIQAKDTWTDEETAGAYTMMESINDVIHSIMDNENFVAELPKQ